MKKQKLCNEDFFHIEDYISQIGKKPDSFVIMINAPRNIGKSTSILSYAVKNSLQDKKRFVYIRNTDNQLDFIVKDFNSTYKNRFHMTKTHIYDMVKEVVSVKDKMTGEVTRRTTYKQNNNVGYVCALSTYKKIKSGAFPDVNVIFYEEYNEEGLQSNIYKKFINILTTISRFSDVELFMIGNKDSANNEYMTLWGIDPRSEDDEGTGESEIYIKFNETGWFWDIPMDKYNNLPNTHTLAYRLAQFHTPTKLYMNGGYMSGLDRQVINYIKWIEPTLKPFWRVTTRGETFTFGTFTYKDSVRYAMISEVNYINDELKVYSLDNISNRDNKRVVLDKTDRQQILGRMYNSYKQKIMFFDSFTTKEYVEYSIIAYDPLG